MTTETKPLPEAPEAEKAVLSNFLLGNENAYVHDEILKDEHFNSRSNRMVFNAIRLMTERNEKVDLVTVTNKLRDLGLLEQVGGAVNLSQTAVKFSAYPPSEYIPNLENKRKLRKTIDFCSRASDACYKGGNSDEILRMIEKEVFYLQETGSIESQTGKATKQVLETIELKLQGKKITGLKTGIYSWDRVLGGLMRARFYVLAARAGKGKTAMVEEMITQQLLLGNPTLIFEKDMSSEMLVSRMACRMADVSFMKYETDHCSNEELVKIQRHTKFLSVAPFYIYSPANLSATDLRSIVKREKKLHGVQSVFLDHILNLDVGNNGYREGLTMASSQIRASVQESELPHVILAQLNREADKASRPNPSHIKEFDALFADCDVMTMLWSEKETQDVPSDEIFPMKFTVNKNRYGATFEDDIGFERKTMKFKTMVK